MQPSTITLDVYARRGGVHGRELIGTADVPAGIGEVLEIASADGGMERIAIGTMTVVPFDGDPRSGPVILLERGQRPERLPGWKPLAKQSSDDAGLQRPMQVFVRPRAA